MRIELELPDNLVSELAAKSRDRHMTPGQYAAELLYQSLALEALGADVPIENRLDWQEALERSRASLGARQVTIQAICSNGPMF